MIQCVSSYEGQCCKSCAMAARFWETWYIENYWFSIVQVTFMFLTNFILCHDIAPSNVLRLPFPLLIAQSILGISLHSQLSTVFVFDFHDLISSQRKVSGTLPHLSLKQDPVLLLLVFVLCYCTRSLLRGSQGVLSFGGELNVLWSCSSHIHTDTVFGLSVVIAFTWFKPLWGHATICKGTS